MGDGVIEFVAALQALLHMWPSVDTIAATLKMPNGHMMTVRLAGPVLELEDDKGALVTVPLSEVEAD